MTSPSSTGKIQFREIGNTNTTTVAPAFNCEGDLNFSEFTICNNSYLSALDNYLNILYLQYMSISFSPETLRNTQRAWIQSRNSCRDIDCIRDLYNTRIVEFITESNKIDRNFTALNPKIVSATFSSAADSYKPIAIEEMGKVSIMNTFFRASFFELIDAEIISFIRSGTEEYNFFYTYEVTYKEFGKAKVTGKFTSNSKGDILGVDIDKQSRLSQMEDTIVKASRPDVDDDLEVIHGLLVELKTEGKNFGNKYLSFFEKKPDKLLSGTGDIPCERHDHLLYRIEGSVFKDKLDCSWGDEVINSFDGDDDIDAGWGDEIIAAGSGSDTIDSSNGNAIIYPGPGNDSIKNSHGNLILIYGKSWGDDFVSGNCSLLIFSKDVSPEDLTWKSKTEVINNKTRGSIKFRDGRDSGCREIYFSNLSFN